MTARPPAEPTPPPLVEMRGISVSFQGVPVLADVDLTLYPGEVHSLMGENGAGKSSLVKVLAGVYARDAGTVDIGGETARIRSVADAQKAGIAAVHQELGLCPNLTIGENVMLGNEPRGRWGIDWRRTHAVAAETLAQLGLADLDSRRPLSSLSPAAQRLVGVARAMVAQPRVLVLDEPTSSLDVGEVAKLFGVVRRLREKGVAIVFVSHFLDQVYAISDRITILRDGRRVGEYLPDDLDPAELISTMFGKDIVGLQAIGSQRKAHRREPTGPPVYRAVGVGRRGTIAPTNIELYPGEIFVLAGLRGSGRTELALLLGAADSRDSGQVFVGDRAVSLSSPRAALRWRIALLSDEGHDGGVVAELTVRENLLLSLQALRGWTRPLSRHEQQSVVAAYLESFKITPPDPDLKAKYLSGGNRRKLALASLLATRPRVLILDEPTSGADVASRVDILRHVAQAATEGVAVVFISSELEDLVRVSDRIVVLKDRRKIGELSNGPAISADTIIEMIAADGRELD
jgi:galactofuranose transport system ATP-binding protein